MKIKTDYVDKACDWIIAGKEYNVIAMKTGTDRVWIQAEDEEPMLVVLSELSRNTNSMCYIVNEE